MKKGREEEIRAFVRLLDIMDELREKCPWDREQTTESLRPLTIEETYELSDAIMNSDDFNISKELGDIMLHIVFYAKIGSEKGTFNIADVMDRCCDKLVYRHPHVFAETQVSGARDVIENWEQLKRKEKDGKRGFNRKLLVKFKIRKNNEWNIYQKDKYGKFQAKYF